MKSNISNISKPFNPSQIEVEAKAATVSTLLDMLRGNLIDMQPDFQRHADLWKDPDKSRLIESIVLGLPLPSFYFEMDRGSKKYIVIDGLQRLCALNDFMTGKLKLQDLEFLGKEWEGVTYDSMPYYDKIEFGLRTVNLNILKGATPPNVKFIIFKRLNSKGLALTPPEIRNALFQGKCTDMIKDLLPVFHQQLGKDFNAKRMKDRDYILRFAAHKVMDYESRHKNLDDFLCEAMQKINTLEDDEVEALKTSFVKTLNLCFWLMGELTFRKPTKDKRRNPVSVALFECLMVELSKLSEPEQQTLLQKKETFMGNYMHMFEIPDMDKAITDGTGKQLAVHVRLETTCNMIKATLADND